MCLQCMAKSRMIKKDILPGYFLVKGTVEVKDEWPKGWYGLVQCNDPDFIWEDKMTPGPMYEMSDKEINSCSKKLEKEDNEWWKKVERINSTFHSTDIMTSHEFVRACQKAGYNPKNNGKNIVAWFVNYVGKKMKR